MQLSTFIQISGSLKKGTSFGFIPAFLLEWTRKGGRFEMDLTAVLNPISDISNVEYKTIKAKADFTGSLFVVLDSVFF